MQFDPASELGAIGQPSPQRLTLYIPDKDRNGETISNHPDWCNEAHALLTEIGGGATAFPPLDGSWRKPDGSVLWERTIIIYTFVDPEKMAANLQRLREFLHRFGREANQGEVVFEFDGWLWSIDNYDPPTGE